MGYSKVSTLFRAIISEQSATWARELDVRNFKRAKRCSRSPKTGTINLNLEMLFSVLIELYYGYDLLKS